MSYIELIRIIAERSGSAPEGACAPLVPDNIKSRESVITPTERVLLKEAADVDLSKIRDIIHLSLCVLSNRHKCPRGASAGEIISYVSSRCDPEWTGVLFPNIHTNIICNFRCFLVWTCAAVSGGINFAVSKSVDDCYEEFLGRCVNTVVQRAPAFVYTYGPRLVRRENGSYPLLIEYVPHSATMTEWLKSGKTADELRFVFYQVVANLVEANNSIGFVHGDLHMANVLIQESEVTPIPTEDGIVLYNSTHRVRFIDYEYSTVVYQGTTYARNLHYPANHESIWTDIFKLLILCHSTFANYREVLSDISARDFHIPFPLSEYEYSVDHSATFPPYAGIYKGLPSLESVAREMRRTLVNTESSKKLVDITYEPSNLALVACGELRDLVMLESLAESTIEALVKYVDNKQSRADASCVRAHINLLKSIHDKMGKGEEAQSLSGKISKVRAYVSDKLGRC